MIQNIFVPPCEEKKIIQKMKMPQTMIYKEHYVLSNQTKSIRKVYIVYFM